MLIHLFASSPSPSILFSLYLPVLFSPPSHPILLRRSFLPLPPSQTFHTPSLGDEEFEIPPISLDPDSSLTVSDVVSHFGELSDAGPSDSMVVPGNAVVGGDDPSFASTFVNPSSQGLEHLSMAVINQPGGGALLGSTLGMVRAQNWNGWKGSLSWCITRMLRPGWVSVIIKPFENAFPFNTGDESHCQK